MKTIYVVIDGMEAVAAFENESDANEWTTKNQSGGEALTLQVQGLPLYENLVDAGGQK
jgi:hypothetical protein